MNPANDERNMRLHLQISGHVQGVGFRMFTQDYAQRIGLTGWVRNTSAGGVEVLAEGNVGLLQIFADALRRGPVGGHVDDLQESWETGEAQFADFSIRF